MAPMLLEIVTAERLVYSDEVDIVVAPGMEGELGILPHHAPLLTILQPGELRIHRTGQEDVYMAVTGGFLEVTGNRVIVLADAAERSEEIDEARGARSVAQSRGEGGEKRRGRGPPASAGFDQAIKVEAGRKAPPPPLTALLIQAFTR